MAAVVELKEVSFSYHEQRQPLFRNFNLSVKKGEFVVLLGLSGIGKSTLLRLVCRLLEATEGSIEVNISAQQDRRPFGFVFQEPRLFPWRRVFRNVLFGLEGLELDSEKKLTRVQDALALTKLDGFSGRWPFQLSGGQRQRVGIARALAVRPTVLLMDEPFNSVDVSTRLRLQNELIRIWRQIQTSILFVTHDINEALKMADRIIVLSEQPARIISEYRIAIPRTERSQSSEIDELLHSIRDDLGMESG